MENENLEENKVEENITEETTILDAQPPKKKKSKLPIIIIIIVIIAAAAVGVTFFIVGKTKNSGFNKAPVAPPSSKPVVDTEETEESEETEPTLDPNEDVSITISEEDKKICAIIKTTIYKALFTYNTYEEINGLMNNGFVILEIKEGGISNASKDFNALMAKSLSKLKAPTTEEKDCYSVLIKEAAPGQPVNKAEIYVMPGISGIKPSEEAFKNADKELGANNDAPTTNPSAAPDPDAESSDVVNLTTELKEQSQKQLIEVDNTSCTAIESVINSALAEEEIYKETIKLGLKGSVLVAVCSTPKLAIAGCGPLMKKELTTSLAELTGPKQAGKDVYYININITTTTENNAKIYKIEKISVITGNKKTKPTAKDFQ